ncbi:BTAD domain-containing putative transcriptional regulator [Hamadaea tsunoensis]|uniref:BTAD domain-containing putative transcriptional regulator n=1 Tax=Hamadaea tsunoensis TaxID=53368 RepID=UPI000415F187|nr:BTAD domain-containing putative transcriptional regulator [Hamadaea tsunoensis]
MLFRVLGALEVESGGGPVVLRGVLQRATLGALALNANKVVSTNQLIRTMWPGEPPATARKMLQNAVAGVRAALRAGGLDPGTELVTHSPGYLLRTDPETVDVCRFHALAAAGRDHLARGEHDRAVRSFDAALRLWRGPVLADLAEAGIAWPETAALDNSMLAVLEEYADAQLTLNRYHEVIERLETVLAEGVFACRERMLAQLMIALYRAGRQADALSVYRRTRTTLVEELGLDPSRELQDLERAILAHDPRLAGAEPVQSSEQAAPAAPVVERKPVTVLMVRVGTPTGPERDPEDLRDIWQRLTGAIASVVGHLGGVLRPYDAGPVWTVQFGVPRTREDDVERALLAAAEIRRCIAGDAAEPVSVHIALTTGEALVAAFGDGARTEVTGGLLDQCLAQLATVPADTITVCDTTRAVTSGAFAYERCAGQTWRLCSSAPRTPGSAVPFVGRGRELQQLSAMLYDVVRDGHPRLATVLGEPGMGKSRLVAEYAAAPAVVDNRVRCVVLRTPSFGYEPVRAVAAALTCSLGQALQPGTGGRLDLRELCARTRDAVFRAAESGPLIVVVEDVHRADDALLDFVEDLIRPEPPLPLLVVATARSELLDRRPTWAVARANSTTIRLEPLPDEAMEILLQSLLDGERQSLRDGERQPAREGVRPGEERRHLVRRAGGNPYFAQECVRELRGDAGLALPRTIHRVIAARIDTLRAEEKAVLQAASILGDEVYEVEVAAVSGRDRGEVADHLRVLERREMLQRMPLHAADDRGTSYRFRHTWIREVAYAQLPRRERAERHRRAAAWLKQRAAEVGRLRTLERAAIA